MNWKREAVEKLRSYAARRQALAAIPQQLEEVQLKRRGIRSSRADGTAVVGGTNGREEMLVNSMVYEEELSRRLEMTKVWVKGVDIALDALTQQEKLILDRFYIHPHQGAVERLCEELNLERASVYRKKDQALRRFIMALYGWEEV